MSSRIRSVIRHPVFLVVLLLSTLFAFLVPVHLDTNSRWFQPTWNFGHVVVFFVWNALIILGGFVQRLNVVRAITVLLVVTVILGGGIELIQLWSGRSASWGDLCLDVAGCCAANLILLWHKIPRLNLGYKLFRIGFSSATAFFILLAFFPYVKILWDIKNSRAQFPVLFDNSTAFQDTRFFGSALRETVYRKCNRRLKITLDVQPYPKVSSASMLGDWRGYDGLHIDLYLEGNDNYLLHLYVVDSESLKPGFEYSDRFEYKHILLPGKNTIRIPMNTIINAPPGRQLDISDIQEFSLYGMHPTKERVIYLDKIMLYRNQSPFGHSPD